VRYDAYVVALGVVAVAVAVGDLTRDGFVVKLNPRTVAVAGLAVLIAAPLINRAVVPVFVSFQGTTNIYEQQYQMAMFVREFYQGQTVVANDIGAINYFADIHCVDVVGLGNREAAKTKVAQNRYLNGSQVDALARKENAQIAIIYTFPDTIPDSWTEVGEWTISQNQINASDTVSFFAVNPSDADKLIASLRAFAPLLPPTVAQAGTYTQSALK
jgi:hypothetical protein